MSEELNFRVEVLRVVVANRKSRRVFFDIVVERGRDWPCKGGDRENGIECK